MIPTRIRKLLLKANNYSDWKKEHHPEPSVRNHLGQVVSLAIKAGEDWDVCFAAMLHDIGKNCPDIPNKWAQHAFFGAMMIAEDVPEKVKWLVENHMRVWPYLSGVMGVHKRAILEQHPWFEELKRLNEYDHGGRNADGVHMPWDEIFAYLDENDKRENTVILMIGVQASGKSTVSKALVDASKTHVDDWMPRYERTSKDDLRLLFGAGPGSFRHQESCIEEIQRKAVRMALGRGQAVIIDNCHNTSKRRARTLEWLWEEFPGLRVEAHLVYAPLEVCIKRNREEHGQLNRHRLLIPEKVLVQFHGDLVAGLGKINNDNGIHTKLRAEGFDSSTITRTYNEESNTNYSRQEAT